MEALMAAWEVCACPPVPGGREIHVFRIATDGDASEAALEFLTPVETARAQRFRFAADRARFVARRIALRRILGRYVGRPDGDLALVPDPAGKLRAPDAPGLPFSLSATADLALAAVAGDVDVGIDVETRRSVPDALDIARGNFAPEEADALATLPDERRSDGFLTMWTRKEAYLKGLGVGLAGNLASPVADGAAPPWQFQSFHPHLWTIASLAVRGAPAAVRFFEYLPS